MAKTPIEMMLDGLAWSPIHGDAKKDMLEAPNVATHQAELVIAGCRLRCYQLRDGRRILNADDVHAFFGGSLPE